MKPSGARAYGYARARAWKSRLLSREDAGPLLAAGDPSAMQRAIEVLGRDSSFQRLLRIYQTALRTHRSSGPLLRALLRLHEIENVKLLWRAAIHHVDADGIRRLWIPLGALATIRDPAAVPATLREVADAVNGTPFTPIVDDVLRAFSNDLGAAELAFDRWASRQLLDEARKLPRGESLARQLIESVVQKRDAEILRRGERWFGLSPAATLLSVAQADPPARADRSVGAILCRRAFRGDPFSLAPIVALIVLAEAEVRAVRALIERQGETALDASLARAIAGSQLA